MEQNGAGVVQDWLDAFDKAYPRSDEPWDAMLSFHPRELWVHDLRRLCSSISEAHSKIDALRESMRLDAETIAAKDRRIAELERQPDDAVVSKGYPAIGLPYGYDQASE